MTLEEVRLKKELTELAEHCIATLDAQRRYFKDRTQQNLIASKAIEGRLRKRCEEVLKPCLFP